MYFIFQCMVLCRFSNKIFLLKVIVITQYDVYKTPFDSLNTYLQYLSQKCYGSIFYLVCYRVDV